MNKYFLPGTQIILSRYGVGKLKLEITSIEGENVSFKNLEEPTTTGTLQAEEIIEAFANDRAEFVLDSFTRGYLVAGLWSESDNSNEAGGDPLDENYDLEDFTPDALRQAIDDCLDFQQSNKALLELYYDKLERKTPESPQGYAGHDFWLTRNGHGAGFWDRGLGIVGEKLSEACKPYGSTNIEVGDDEQLHLL